MRNIPYTTLYPRRREGMRATCVEHVELVKAVGRVGLAAVLKGRRTETSRRKKLKIVIKEDEGLGSRVGYGIRM